MAIVTCRRDKCRYNSKHHVCSLEFIELNELGNCDDYERDLRDDGVSYLGRGFKEKKPKEHTIHRRDLYD